MAHIFHKLMCKHKWKSHAKSNEGRRKGTFEKFWVVTTIEVLICDNCGKIKTIEY